MLRSHGMSFFTSGPNIIIGAAIFIAETMNVALTGIDNDINNGVLDCRMRLEKESGNLAKMYDTLSGYSLYPKFADSVESLGEVVVALYVIVSY
jgi:hypothetical protein